MPTRTMWVSVPGFGRYIFNSFFISIIVTAVVSDPGRSGGLCLRPLRVPGPGHLLGAFLAVNMFSGAVLLIPLFRLMRCSECSTPISP